MFAVVIYQSDRKIMVEKCSELFPKVSDIEDLGKDVTKEFPVSDIDDDGFEFAKMMPFKGTVLFITTDRIKASQMSREFSRDAVNLFDNGKKFSDVAEELVGRSRDQLSSGKRGASQKLQQALALISREQKKAAPKRKLQAEGDVTASEKKRKLQAEGDVTASEKTVPKKSAPKRKAQAEGESDVTETKKKKASQKTVPKKNNVSYIAERLMMSQLSRYSPSKQPSSFDLEVILPITHQDTDASAAQPSTLHTVEPTCTQQNSTPLPCTQALNTDPTQSLSTQPQCTQALSAEHPFKQTPSTEPPLTLSTELPFSEALSTQPPCTQALNTDPKSTQSLSTQPQCTQAISAGHPFEQTPSTEPPLTLSAKHPFTEALSTPPPCTQALNTDPKSTQSLSTQPQCTQALSAEHPSTQTPSTEPPLTLSTEPSFTAEALTTESLFTPAPKTVPQFTQALTTVEQLTQTPSTELVSTPSNSTQQPCTYSLPNPIQPPFTQTLSAQPLCTQAPLLESSRTKPFSNHSQSTYSVEPSITQPYFTQSTSPHNSTSVTGYFTQMMAMDDFNCEPTVKSNCNNCRELNAEVQWCKSQINYLWQYIHNIQYQGPNRSSTPVQTNCQMETNTSSCSLDSSFNQDQSTLSLSENTNETSEIWNNYTKEQLICKCKRFKKKGEAGMWNCAKTLCRAMFTEKERQGATVKTLDKTKLNKLHDILQEIFPDATISPSKVNRRLADIFKPSTLNKKCHEKNLELNDN